MQHHAGPHPGADVGRAGGQVAELVAEGVTDALFQHVVNAVDLLPGLVEGEAAANDLQAQVVLLVDHQADRLLRGDGDAARPLGGSQLTADKLTFHQELAVEGVQAGDVQVAEGGVQVEPADALAQHRLDLGLLVAARPVGEGEGGQVAGQADPAGNDDVGFRPRPAQPFATGMSQVIQIHPWHL